MKYRVRRRRWREKVRISYSFFLNMSDGPSHRPPVVRHSTPDPQTEGCLHPHVQGGGVPQGPLEHVDPVSREVGRGDRGQRAAVGRISSFHTINLWGA